MPTDQGTLGAQKAHKMLSVAGQGLYTKLGKHMLGHHKTTMCGSGHTTE